MTDSNYTTDGLRVETGDNDDNGDNGNTNNTTTNKRPTRRRKAHVIFAFETDEENQLSIKEGQEITVIGEPTAEKWILAENADEIQGYIPDGYFEIILKSKSKPKKPKKKSPALPETMGYSYGRGRKRQTNNNNNNDGTFLDDEDDDDDAENGRVYEMKDTYTIFAYQFEWFTIPILFLSSLFSFMYAGTQPLDDRWRLYILSWTGFVASAITAYLCGIARNKFSIKESFALVRMVMFLFDCLLLLSCYPIGASAGVLCLITALIEFRVWRMKCKMLPNRIKNEWCAQMFGGFQHCPPLKLIIFFAVLAVDLLCIGWGFLNGYSIAMEVNENLRNSNHLQPTATALMHGFGRIVTINMVCIFLFSCKLMLGCLCLNKCCRKCICDRCARIGKSCDRSRNNSNSEENASHDDNVCSVLPNSFFHRCLGYGIVWASVLHMICAYYAYINSGPAHAFMDEYGYESYATGCVVLVFLAVVIASSNSTLRRNNERLFKQTHWMAIVLVVLLMFHGSISRNFGYFWMFTVGPVVLYSCDVFTRYALSG